MRPRGGYRGITRLEPTGDIPCAGRQRPPIFAALSLLLALLVISPSSASTVELRDITVKPASSGKAATVHFLVSGNVATVVLEPRGGGAAQIRIKSISASASALNSALLKPGVLSIKAHIERRDVLVTNIAFRRAVVRMSVLRRDAERVVVHIMLGEPLAPSTAGNEQVTATPSPRTSSPTSKSTSPPSSPSSGTAADKARGRWSLSTIVIDPGHGGKDPGAIGIDDIREKDVTLSVSLKLRNELRKHLPGINVVMTREDDRFIELFRRGQIANKVEGKLFISIHCNSMPEKPHPASGFECYILRPGKSDDAARVAAAENGAINFESNKERYKDMATESAIMASMAQSAFARYSEILAGSIKRAMRSSLSIPDRGVHQAGFYVLVGAAMPATLIEIGYLSNERDARVLASAEGQLKIAQAICQGIKAYERQYSATLRD